MGWHELYKLSRFVFDEYRSYSYSVNATQLVRARCQKVAYSSCAWGMDA